MASRSCFAMKGLQASESNWKHPSEAKTPYLEDQSTHHSALWEFLKDKNIWRVENINTRIQQSRLCFRLQKQPKAFCLHCVIFVKNFLIIEKPELKAKLYFIQLVLKLNTKRLWKYYSCEITQKNQDDDLRKNA